MHISLETDLTKGRVLASLMGFAAPLIIGNILQQVYSITDTLIVGKYIGENALAAVGGTYTLTTFLYSLIIGLCMGSGGLISYYHGLQDDKKTRQVATGALFSILFVTILLNIATVLPLHSILELLKTPEEILEMALSYTRIILSGMLFVFLYNFYAYVLRAVGNSLVPMLFLAGSTVMNIGLDIFLVVFLEKGVEGAAIATVLSQIAAGLGILLYAVCREKTARPWVTRQMWSGKLYGEILRMSFGAGIQQSVMNFGILMIQGLVNSFGAATMAAFSVAVKIDTLAYMPAQEFANAFSLFISQNYGANQKKRIREGIKYSVFLVIGFCLFISCMVFLFANPLMRLFLKEDTSAIVAIGVKYLHIEGIFYFAIGILFLLYGYFRGINQPGISLLLTVISLGTRVLLAYSGVHIAGLGVLAIWTSIPIGWILADGVGILLLKKSPRSILRIR